VIQLSQEIATSTDNGEIKQLKPVLEILGKQFFLAKDISNFIPEANTDMMKIFITEGMPWLLYGGSVYINKDDWDRTEKGYYKDLVKNNKYYEDFFSSSSGYGCRYKVNNKYIKSYFERFIKWKGYLKPKEMSYLERIEFEVYMDKYFDKNAAEVLDFDKKI